jgi:protein TonB
MAHGASSPTPAPVPHGGPIPAAEPKTASAARPRFDGYLSLCRSLIERRKEYPVMARRGRIEGTVTVGCVVQRDGSLQDSGVARTSGSPLLDSAALRAVRSIGRFPPFPPEIRGNELDLEVPITYRLATD